MNEDIYTTLIEAKNEINKRQKNNVLARKINDYLKGDMPLALNNRPKILLFRHIMTPNNESYRCLEIAKKLNFDPIGFEFTKDKFVSFNPDKQSLVILPFYLGKKMDGKAKIYKKKIVDMNFAQGKIFSSITTLWKENLVDFHHDILYKVLPIFKNNVYDISEWLIRNGPRARQFYQKFMALLLRNYILVESYMFKDIEGEFTKKVILPAFKKVEKIFGFRPLIIQLAPENSKINPYWWYYPAEIKTIVEDYIKNYQG